MIASERIEQMVAWRHHLHQAPEWSAETVKTASFVSKRLMEFGYEVHPVVGGHGVVARLKRGDGDSIGLRADMDALRIKEQTGLPYASNNGYMHACGHDGHTAMLLGAAREIIESGNFSGTVNLIFQPAEETTVGARAMIEDGLFQRFPMDEIYGLHNAPFKPLGTVSTRVGSLMSGEDNFRIVISGKGCHASSPHEGVDPFLCFSQIYSALQAIVSRNCNPTHSVVISCTEINSDGARNAIPSFLEIKGDVRCFSTFDQSLIEARMREICNSVCTMNGAEASLEYFHECASVCNDKGCVEHVCDAARSVVGIDRTDDSSDIWMASEDFSFYLAHVPGCFFLLGAGNQNSEAGKEAIPLHNSRFDFNDKLLPIGAMLWKKLVEQRLKVR